MIFLWIGFQRQENWLPDRIGTYPVRAISVEEVEQGVLEQMPAEEEQVALIRESDTVNVRMEKYRSWKKCCKNLRILPIGSETVMSGLGNVSAEDVETGNAYWYYGGRENRENLFQWLLYRYAGGRCPAPPRVMPADGIVAVGGEEIYADWETAKQAGILPGEGPKVGLLLHRSLWAQESLKPYWKLCRILAGRGIGVVTVVLEGGNQSRPGSRAFRQLIRDCFYENGTLQIDGIINQLIFTAEASNGKSMYEAAAEIFEECGIPVFGPIASYFCTEEEYSRSSNPLQEEMPWSYLTPELQGMTEPVLIALRNEQREICPVTERMEHFAGRVARHLRLASLPSAQKKLVLMLHNAPCSGVEATVGTGYELQVMESAANLLQFLKKEGYSLTWVPENGEALRRRFFEKKAYSDFRWTNVEQICQAGGDLYRMGMEEYLRYYETLPAENREKLESMYGAPPGEGMVLERELVITGLDLGNVLVMLEPKRGCYGAKCTGEVCKILQDPHCPPTHQYLAAFWYIQNQWMADAVVHLGTHGSVEFLPGKSTALSDRCWPNIVTGELPVFYIYHMNVPGEALMAKRRAYAVLLGHLPAVEGSGWHIWGKDLEEEEKLSYIEEVRRTEEKTEAWKPEEEKELLEALAQSADNEKDSLRKALNGKYTAPGIYGGPDQNGREILPAGRNIYTMDVKKIPTREAFSTGKELAEKLIAQYLEEEHHYPEQVAMNMISQDITRSKGIQVSQFLYLMGIMPVWDSSENVTGLDIISLEELGRPRVDVTLRISGVLRDAWPQVVELMDDGALLAASLKEPPEQNYVRRHTLELLSRGADTEISRRQAVTRIFGDPPGTFGAGIDLALKASAWKDEKDLARYFTEASAYAYGRKLDGRRMLREFTYHVGHTDATWDHTATRRYDILAAGFSAQVQGGFKLAARYLGGRKVRQYQGNSCVTPRLASVKDALRECLENTILDPVWKEQMMEQGYQGAAEMMHRLQNMFTWQCANDAVDDGVIDQLVQAYVLDPRVQEFMQKENPYAMEEIARRFLELHSRGKWKAEENCLKELQSQYLQAEGDLEDQIADAGGEWQGGSIEIIADDQIEIWKQKLSEVDQIFGKETEDETNR